MITYNLYLNLSWQCQFYKMSYFPIVIILISFGACSSSQPGELVATLCRAKLENPRYTVTPVYDGDDYVYIFVGVSTNGADDEVLRYNILSDQIESVGYQRYLKFRGGVATLVPNSGNKILYISGYYNDALLEFDRNTNTSRDAEGKIPEQYFNSGAVIVSNETILYVGSFGHKTDIYSINPTQNYTVTQLGDTQDFDSHVLVETKPGSTLLFGYCDPSTIPVWLCIKRLNTTTGLADNGTIVSNVFMTSVDARGVWDGLHVYVFGSFYVGGITMNGAMRYDPESGTADFLTVAGFPHSDRWQVVNTGVVYVEKMNRVYLFGGASSIGIARDDIWYVDLMSK